MGWAVQATWPRHNTLVSSEVPSARRTLGPGGGLPPRSRELRPRPPSGDGPARRHLSVAPIALAATAAAAWRKRSGRPSRRILGWAPAPLQRPGTTRCADDSKVDDEQQTDATRVSKRFIVFQWAEQAVDWISKHFVIWLALISCSALAKPALFSWVRNSWFQTLLSLLMFSVGVTTSIDDFKVSLKKRTAVLINFSACFGLMPALAYSLAKLIGADGPTLAGFVLIGSINGGHTSNLCTLIAGGDVALSVLMTMSTTVGCIFATPLIAKFVLGTVVPVNGTAIVLSTLQVVLLPTVLGLGLNYLFPRSSQRIGKLTPALGVMATCLVVGSSVASCQSHILAAGVSMQLAVIALHLIGGILGYIVSKLLREQDSTCRTVAIETAMKSSAVGYLLAVLHFDSFYVRVPAAVSVVWSSMVGSFLAAYWRKHLPSDSTA